MTLPLATTSEQKDEQVLLRRRAVYAHLNTLLPDVFVEPPHGPIIVVSYNDSYDVALAKLPKGEYSILGIAFIWRSEIKDEAVFSHVLGCELPVIPLSKLKGYVYAKKFVVYPQREHRIETQYFRTRRILSAHGINHYSTLEAERDFLTAKRFIPSHPNILAKNINDISQVYEMFSTFSEKDTYLRYIMGTLTRNKSFTRQTQKISYYHKNVLFHPGDIVLDAGISRDITSSVFISEQCGKSGKVFGFEPSPEAFTSAQKALKKAGIRNYELIREGLWKETVAAYCCSEIKGRSSIILLDASQKQFANVDPCLLSSIDDFVIKKGLTKVSAIKMDIEGAELDVLIGASETIQKYKPKLFISIYHNFSHLYEIPLLIKKISPSYQFYLEQHSWNLYDLTLFAIDNSGVRGGPQCSDRR